jgi:class 3 adenylate cyclase
MREALAQFNREHADLCWQVRIGLHSGSAVAGVIGRRKFSYDLWGDAVNTASRMETEGVPGRIQMSNATRLLVEGRCMCEPRGVIAVKGKGRMAAWFLEGMRA